MIWRTDSGLIIGFPDLRAMLGIVKVLVMLVVTVMLLSIFLNSSVFFSFDSVSLVALLRLHLVWHWKKQRHFPYVYSYFFCGYVCIYYDSIFYTRLYQCMSSAGSAINLKQLSFADIAYGLSYGHFFLDIRHSQ